MQEYPRTVILEDKRLASFLKEKGELIKKGIAKSEEIETIEKDMTEIDKQVRVIEKTVDITDIDERAKLITESFNAVVQQMEDIKKEISARLSAAIPPEMIKEYDDKKKKKESLENERNKIALKVQKFNDKIIPLGQRLMKPMLQDEFEDYGSLQLEEDKVVATIFSHMADFTDRFLKKKKPNAS